MSDNLVCAPAEIPSQFLPDLELLHKQTRTLFDYKKVPYFIQANFAKEKYCSVEDLADRWDTAEEARKQAPAELHFKDGKNDYDAQESKLAAMRLYRAAKMAKGAPSPASTSGLGLVIGSSEGRSPCLSSDSTCERSYLELQFQALRKIKPQLEDQGSESLMRRQFAFCKKGEIGFIQVKHVVSYLPDLDERQNKRQRKSLVSGFLVEEDDEERSYPTTFKQMEHLHKVFYTNLLMCTSAFPQFKQLSITLEEVNLFYTWLHGPAIASRTPPPTVGVVIRAERLAWKEIAKHMHLGKTLSESLALTKADLLFWSREVYEKVVHTAHPSASGLKGGGQQWQKGKGKGKDGGDRLRSSPYNAPSGKGLQPKGRKGKGKNLSKGKSKSKPPAGWPSNWALTTPKGVEFCQAYHLRNNCPGKCNRSHNCAVMKDGWTCNQPPQEYHPSNCPSS